MDIAEQANELGEYKILVSHLTRPDDLHAAISRLTQPLVESPASPLSGNDLETRLCNTWTSVLLLASQTEHNSAKQDELVRAIKTLVSQESLKDRAGKSIEIDGSKVWSDLPLFGQQVRGCWNFPENEEVDESVKDKWINVNAFIAKLTAAAWEDSSFETQSGFEPAYTALDFSLYGIWTIRSALEEKLPAKGNTVDAQLGAASAWVIYANPVLGKLCEEGKQFQGKVARPGSQFKTKEWRGYHQERWEIWQEELLRANKKVQSNMVKELMEKASHIIEETISE